MISFAFTLMVVVPATTNIFASEAVDEVAPAPPSIGADIPLTYFGPAPSEYTKRVDRPIPTIKIGSS